MSLQRRLLVYLLVCAPLVWAAALLLSVQRGRHEVDELFDSEIIRLARQVQVTLRSTSGGFVAEAEPSQDSGEADVSDLAIAVWDAQGGRVLADREGVQLPYRRDVSGFVDLTLDGDAWRVYYLQSFDGSWLIAAGQKAYERDEIIFDLSVSQVLPWVLMLPVLLMAMAWAVRRSLEPVRHLADEIRGRDANDLRPMPEGHAPTELRPMVEAVNGLLVRIRDTLERERRFTADAAHELRTPLAVLRAQWDVLRRAGALPERERAERQLTAGLDRLDRLVTQMLSLSRVESRGGTLNDGQEIDWPPIVEQAVNDCLALSGRRDVEMSVEWPKAGGKPPFPLIGDASLLTVMLRNLLDNAVRYAPRGSTVLLRMRDDGLSVENDGEPISQALLSRLGERFYRPDGQEEGGSGLGVSIVTRVAEQHGLIARWRAGADGRGLVAEVAFPGVPGGAAG